MDCDLRNNKLSGTFGNWIRPLRRHVKKHGEPERLLVSPRQHQEFTELCARFGDRPATTFKGIPVVVVEPGPRRSPHVRGHETEETP